MRMALLALCIPAVCLAQAPAQPRLSLEVRHHDFGQLAPDATVTHRFKASNTGSAPLTITSLNASCGCTSTVVGKSVLAPGESTELEVTFHAEGSAGPARKSVQVLSDDPLEPVQTLTFEADVRPEVIPSTSLVRFEDLTRKDRRQASVKLASGTSQAIQLADVALSEAPWLGVTTREVGRDLWVDFDLLARRLPPDQLHGTDSVTLQLRNPRPSTVLLKVQWELRAPVTATPARVAWAEPAGRELRAPVLLRSRDHSPFRILAARTSSPLLQVAGIAPGSAARQQVQLVLSATAPAGNYEEKAFLTLDTPGHPEFEFRVAATLR